MSKKRATVEGNIRKRKDVLWEGRYPLGTTRQGRGSSKTYWARPTSRGQGKKDLTENGRSDPKGSKTGLSTTTVRSVHLMLHNTLERVRKEKVITANPTEDCIPPNTEKGNEYPEAR